MKFQIFSSTPNKYSRNSAELHRYDVDGPSEIVEAVIEELEEKGHRITGCLYEYEENDDSQASHRQDSRRF